MAADLEKLVVSLSADVKSYERGLAKAQNTTITALRKMEGQTATSMARVEKSFAKAGSALAGFGKGLVIGAIVGAVAGLEELVRGSITSAAAIGDLSDKLGITSDKLQELQYGAVQANMDFGELEKNLLKFSKSLGEARNGSGDLLKTLEANGFTQAQIKALSYSEALDVVADLIKNAANEQDAMVIATQAFGRAGDDMLEFLRNGSAGLKNFADDAKNAGAIVAEDLIKSAQAFDDAWSAALLNVKSGITKMVLGAVPWITAFDKAVSDSANRLGVFLGTLDPKVLLPLTPGNTEGKGDFVGSKTNRQPVSKVGGGDTDAGKAKAEAATKALVDQKKAIEGVITALQFEIEQGKVSELQQQINIELRKAGTGATAAEREQIISLTTAKFNQAQAEEDLIKRSEDHLEAQKELNDAMRGFAQDAYDAFEAIAIGGEKATDVIKDLANSLLKAAVQASLFGSGPFASLFGTAGGGGVFGGLFKGRAGGGHVNAGEPVVVGERRAELFVPSQSGSIIPKISGGRSTYKVTVINQTPMRVETQQDSSGNPLIFVRQAVADAIGGGFADSALRTRHGLTAQKARR